MHRFAERNKVDNDEEQQSLLSLRAFQVEGNTQKYISHHMQKQFPIDQEIPMSQQPTPMQQPPTPSSPVNPSHLNYSETPIPSPAMPSISPEKNQSQFLAEWYPRINLKIAKKAFSRIGWALLAMMLISELAFGYFDSVLSFWLPAQFVLSGEWSSVLSILAQYIVGLTACVAIMLSIPSAAPSPSANASWKTLTFGRFFTIFVMCLPVMYAGNIIGSSLAEWLSAGHFSNILDTLLEQATTPMSMILDLLITVILAPIVEEFVFRKLIIDRIHRYGELLAVVVSGLAFGLMHANIYQFFYTFGIGMIWAYVYLRTGKLRYTIALHMSVNTLGGAIPVLIGLLPGQSLDSYEQAASRAQAQGNNELSELEELLPMLAQPQVLATICFGIVMILLVIVGIVMWVRNRRMFVFHHAQWQLVPGIAVRTAWCNPGMIVYLICTVCLTLVFPVITVFSLQ